jgi:hypothetical protein
VVQVFFVPSSSSLRNSGFLDLLKRVPAARRIIRRRTFYFRAGLAFNDPPSVGPLASAVEAQQILPQQESFVIRHT